MNSKLHNVSSSDLIQCVLFCFLIILHSAVWAQAQQSSTAPAKEDMTKLHWLIRLSTEQCLRQNVYDPDAAQEKIDAAKQEALDDLTKNMSVEEKKLVQKFRDLTSGWTEYSYLIRLNGYICKRWPCPPPPVKPENFYWLIRAMRDREFRESLFNPKAEIRKKALDEIKRSHPTDFPVVEFAGETENEALLAGLGKILNDVWGTPGQ